MLGWVNGLSHWCSVIYGVMALSPSVADLLPAARIAWCNQAWPWPGGPKSTGYSTENSEEAQEHTQLSAVDGLPDVNTPEERPSHGFETSYALRPVPCPSLPWWASHRDSSFEHYTQCWGIAWGIVLRVPDVFVENALMTWQRLRGAAGRTVHICSAGIAAATRGCPP